MIKLGSHISFTSPRYLIGAVEESLENKANVMMIYLGAPQNTKRVDVEQYNINQYNTFYKDKIKPEDIIIHAPYIVNPANPTKWVFSANFLIDEIKRMNSFGAKYLVLHPGAFTIFDTQNALKTLAKSLKYIFSKTKDVVICLETMSGKGTEIGITYEQIMYLINELKTDRLAACLDTCHVWDAGYNIQKYDQFKKELKESGLLEHIKVIHLNDSKNPLSSHRDRHENIGKGHIGFESLQKVVFDSDFDNIPIILETPWVDNKPIYKEEIALLLNKK
ncbi:deoxyribonuclease IV [Mycoplasmopsis alligatoris]|uniref:Probable endonuclease 4 n=1 Tax=Mycoplasmopsis alligatoris A21JP2 TaxID=747682 RepID=D4XVM4_9BACT|nr:deoxyribonuclease IV [Mycoplasmopsis alligatoris]EFF41695.1 apurinic endonuclease (APN1) [Mycoplasmopsis alligatoris A21JP2]